MPVFSQDHLYKDESVEYLTKKVGKSSGIVFAGIIAGGLLLVMLNIILSRTLGPNEYGLFSLGMTVFVITNRISFLGLQNSLLRFVPLYKGIHDTARMKGTVIFVAVFTFLLAAVIGIILSLLSGSIAHTIFKKYELTAVLVLFFASLPFCNLFTVGNFTLQALQRMRLYVFLKYIFQPVLNIIIVLMFFWIGIRLQGALWAFLSSCCITALVSVFCIKKVFPEITSNIEPVYEISKLFQYAIPVLFINSFNLLLINSGHLFIGYYRTAADVGIYTIAAKVALAIALVHTSVAAIMASVLSDLFNRKKLAVVSQLLKTGTRWVFTFTFPVVVLCIVFAKEIMSIFGSSFVAGHGCLIVLAIAYLVNVVTGTVGLILLMSGRQNIEFINGFLATIVNIVLNIVLINKMGILGAAIATGISMILVNIARLAQVKLIFNIQPYDRKYVKPFIAGIILIMLSVCVRSAASASMYWVFWSAVLAGGYFLVVGILGPEHEDRIVLRSIRQKIFVRTNR